MFPVSVTAGVWRVGKGKEGIVEVVFELVAAGIVAHHALRGELGQGGADGGGAQAAELAQAVNGEGFLPVSQDATNALNDRLDGGIGEGVAGAGQSQGRAGLGEVQRDVVLGRSDAMLGGEGQLGALAAQVEVGVAPAVEFAGAAQGLARAGGVGVLAGVMNQEHGQLELALQLAQEGQEASDLGGVVLIDAVQTDQGIEDEQAGLALLDGVGEELAIGRRVQSQGGGGDDFDGQGLEGNLGGSGDAFQPLADDGQGVLGGKEQDVSGACHRILAQAGPARGDAHGDVQRQEAFTALGLCT